MMARAGYTILACVAACAVLTVGCGLDSGGLFAVPDGSLADGGARDADASGTPDATLDGASMADAGRAADSGGEAAAGDDVGTSEAASDDGGAAAEAGSEAGPCGNTTNPCVVVPSGWSLVAFATSQSVACPTGFSASSNRFEGPSVSGNPCTCGTCGVTAQPSCASGSIAVYYDSDGSMKCNQLGTVTPLSNNPAGSCLTDVYQGRYTSLDLKYVPPPASGGACTAPGTAPAPNVTYGSQDRQCTPDSAQAAGCSGSACSPSLPSAYRACITAPGSVSCPPGPLSEEHRVGTGTLVSCTACSCAVTAQCSGTLTLYRDTACTMGALPFPADDACYASAATGFTTYQAYRYTAAAPQSVACQSSGTSSVSGFGLAGQTTICCAP